MYTLNNLGRACLSIACLMMLSACTYNGVIKDINIPQEYRGNKSSLSVTLIDDELSAYNPSYWHGILTLNYDVSDAMLNGVQKALKNSYSKVEVAKSRNGNSDLFARLNYNFATSKINKNLAKNDMSAGLLTTASISFFDKNDKLLKKLESTEQTTYSDPASLNMLRVLTYGTLGLATPITIPMVRTAMGDYGLKLVSNNVNGIIKSLDREISESKVYNTDGLIVHNTNINSEEKAVKTETTKPVVKVDACIKDNPWQVGYSAKRVDCLNREWNDYNPKAKAIVDEFKSYRLNLAKQLDAGSIDSDEFSEEERNALNKVIEKVALLSRNISYERLDNTPELLASKNESKSLHSAVSNGILYERLEENSQSSSKTLKPKAATMVDSKGIVYERLDEYPKKNATEAIPNIYDTVENSKEQTESIQSTNPSLDNEGGATIMTDIGALLGSTLKLAVAALPIVARVLIARDAARTQAAWNAYYSNQYGNAGPRLITHCRRLGSNMISCF